MRSLLACLGVCLIAGSAAPQDAKAPAHVALTPAELKWGEPPLVLTVVSGTFALGMGDKFDGATLKDLPGGGYGLLPAEMRHFAMARTAAIVQVHGIGPFALTYVNPADDPSQAPPAK